MDSTSRLMIVAVMPLERPRLAVDTSDGQRHYADLSSFSRVYCFPPDQESWEQVSIDSHGLDLVWSSRFEVHADQVLGLSDRHEDVTLTDPRSTGTRSGLVAPAARAPESSR